MPINIQDKKKIVIEIKEAAKKALSAIIVDSQCINVEKITELRKEGRKNDVYIRVVRNTLIKRALEKTPYEILKNSFTGPTLIAFSNKHPGTAARLFKNFSNINPSFKIKAAAFEGKLISSENINILVSIPTHEEAIVSLISTIQEAFAKKLIRTIIAICNQKKSINTLSHVVF